jgi:hypothetical protein
MNIATSATDRRRCDSADTDAGCIAARGGGHPQMLDSAPAAAHIPPQHAKKCRLGFARLDTFLISRILQTQ